MVLVFRFLHVFTILFIQRLMCVGEVANFFIGKNHANKMAIFFLSDIVAETFKSN